MSLRNSPIRTLFVALALIPIALLLFSCSPLHAQSIPPDPQATCTVTNAQFDSWFQSGSASLNGVVKPADSLDFNDTPNCSFYQWAYQMFLWLTSPAPATYCGGGARVFDSGAFFDVSPESGGIRTLITHTCNARPLTGIIRNLNLRAAQVGPNGLPVVISTAGKLFEVEIPPLSAAGKPLVFSAAGAAVEVQSITVKDGKATFIDKTGKPVVGLRPILRNLRPAAIARVTPAPDKLQVRATAITKSAVLQRFIAGGIPIFLDALGNVIEVEQGQANTDGVLMSQTNSLVYFGITVNDVYAYFRTGVTDGFISPTGGNPGQFPTTASDLAQITGFAAAHGATFPDPNALAIEIKTAWVDASTLPDASNYITVPATVPAYSKGPAKWTQSGSQNITLALVGMHVVGSTGSGCVISNNPPVTGPCPGGPPTPGHPEMIWATFEHIGNTPLDAYNYNSTGQSNKPVARDTSGTWLFSQSNIPASTPDNQFNCMHMVLSGSDIVPATASSPCPAGSFTPSNSLRLDPFGAGTGSPNPIDGSAANSNTEIISINNSVRGLISPGDIRANYYTPGATWTIFGAPPSGANEVGTSLLAGSSMETYTMPSNCLGCHLSGTSTKGLATTDISHIFSVIQALSFAGLSARVTPITTIGTIHRIEVTVTNSGTGAPFAGATVRVSGAGGAASGTTSSAGTVTLSYTACTEVIQGGERGGPLKPIIIHLPCEGSVTAHDFNGIGFSAP
jgi:hypothetical protein